MRTVIVQAACDFCGKPFDPEELAWDSMPVAYGKTTYLVDVCDVCLTDVADKSVIDVFGTIQSASRVSETEPGPKQRKRLRKPYAEEEGPFWCHAPAEYGPGVCGRKFDRYQGLGTHLTRTHRIMRNDKIPLLDVCRKAPGEVDAA